MMANKLHATSIVLLFLAGTSAGAEPAWPPLPTSGFLVGRPASQTDVSNGDAIFALGIKGKIIGRPLSIQIPQYAVLKETKERVIVVQAEEANGLRILGVRTFNGKATAAMQHEVELLGTQRPLP